MSGSVSTGRALIRSATRWLPVIVLNALVQALLVLGDPVPMTSWAFAGLVVASAAAVVATVVALTVLARRAVAGGSVVPTARLLAWTVILGVLLGVVAVVFPWVTPALLVPAAAPLAAVAAGRPARRAWTAFHRAPVRTGLTAVGLLVLAVLSWPVALVLGFFVTGPVGAGATWLWFGLVAAVVCTFWAVAVHRWSTAT